MSNFIVQFQLTTERYQEDILDKRLEIGRKMYNALINVTYKRYKEMIKTRAYRELIDKLKSRASDKDQTNIKLSNLRKEYGISEYAFHSDIKNMQKHFKENIDSFTAQKIATRLWKAYEKNIFEDGKRIHYKKYGSFNSLEGKSNKTGIRYSNNYLYYNGLTIPVRINYKNQYEAEAIQREISYCRIVRRYVRNKYKYYLQIVFKGSVPQKIDCATGKIKRTISKGDIGLDIGTQTVAISSITDVKIYELADKVQNIENKKRNILRGMDRSRRTTNKDNFNEDGTVKKQGNKKITWFKSKRYIKKQLRLKELYRKQADVRKMQHEEMANNILKLGDTVYVETMSFKGLQRKTKKSEKNEQGKYKSRKRFGKSIANKAPAMFLDILDRKLKYHDRKLIKIDTCSVKASQYNHIEDKNTKKKLSQRWNDINGNKVQRDMYSAFLIMNVDNGLKSINKVKCDQNFDNFMKLHNIEVSRLKNNKNLSSIAI